MSDGGQGGGWGQRVAGREAWAPGPPVPLWRSGAWETPGREGLEKRAAQTVAVCVQSHESYSKFNRPPLWYLEAERFQTSARGQLEP